MTTIVVLYNLQPGVSWEDYEQWAKEKDIPTVRSLPSVAEFRVLRMGNLLGSDTPSPYRYCEIIEVKDMDAFFSDVSTEAVQEGAKVFSGFADAPQFIVANAL
ncbi:MAG: REDY-like protein HapK [Bacteroidetes bacterium]|nr:REDY-like protein HapK [Bacteroidota bacterium]